MENMIFVRLCQIIIFRPNFTGIGSNKINVYMIVLHLIDFAVRMSLMDNCWPDFQKSDIDFIVKSTLPSLTSALIMPIKRNRK